MASNQFRVPIAKVKAPPIESHLWYWNPNRFGVRFAPRSFMDQLHALGEELSATWHPLRERWIIWSKAPRINHKVCHGWKLLFVNQEPDGSYLPLDERTLARLYLASTLAHGSAKAYFDRIKLEMDRDKERRERQNQQDLIDMAMPSWEHSQIQVAMSGKSNGSKFSTYHS